ncbi:amidohydrolase family protein [Methanoculleus caldifontis]|uniref:amidohydrolase family protein n=1 Tax=Methanoculleus caldifontis TaxID=2651577 RepID=UPI0029372DD9|nr:amidohydrolase family protein [Methanoculleus sp. Wushi-C6]
MEIIDCHAHVTASGQWFDTPYEASIENLEEAMARSGIARAVLIPLGHASIEDVRFCLDLAKKQPEKFAVVPQINVAELSLLTEYKDVVAGLKVHPSLQQVDPASPEVQEILDAASGMGKPVVFDTFMQSTTIPIRLLDPKVFDELAKNRRDITFVLAHSCWPHLLDAYIIAKANKNVYLDLSYFGKAADNTYLLHDFCHLLEKLDQKAIFGTDFPEVDVAAYTALWQRYLHHLPEDKQKRIFSDNAREVFRL